MRHVLFSFFILMSGLLIAEEKGIEYSTAGREQIEYVDAKMFKTAYGMYFFQVEDMVYIIEEMVHSDMCPCVRWGMPTPHYAPANSYIDIEPVPIEAKVWKRVKGDGFFIELGHYWFVTLYSSHKYNPPSKPIHYP